LITGTSASPSLRAASSRPWPASIPAFSSILDAEGEPVGYYVLDLYDLHLHNVLEGDAALIRAAKALNIIAWDDYPPAQFMPSSEAIAIMDGALFHNQIRTDVEAEIDADPEKARLGDVFLAPAAIAGAHPPPADVNPDPPRRHVYIVLSQACDLQHGDAGHLLLLRGAVRPYSWKQHDVKAQSRTPAMRVDDELFAVEGDVLAPETLLIRDLPKRQAEGYRRVRRFRTPFALQLQQAFIGRLGRVGTVAALPARHAAGVRVFLRNRAGEAVLLAEAGIDADEAVCLVGRTAKNVLIDWLLLSERLRLQIRRNLRGIATEDLPGNNPPVTVIRDDPAFYRLLQRGLALKRDSSKGSKPFLNTPYDIVQVLTSRVLEEGDKVDQSYRPIIMEVELA
jgi:hypothetical protein